MIKATILFAEDDISLGFLVKDGLTLAGYTVVLCHDGQAALDTFRQGSFDLCLFDIMMPEMDGLALTREIRRQDAQVPILFLTARAQPDDRLEGFKSGGDDYITKPFSMQELVYRMEVFLKRTGKAPEEPSGTIQLGTYRFDHGNLALISNSHTQLLTQKEADLLKHFIQHRGNTLRREELLEAIWGENDYFLGRSMDVFIARLRKYLAEDPALKISNVHGVGFRLEA
jgi:DNA-binding response OmpR family regulator